MVGTCSPRQRSAAVSIPACPRAVDLSCYGAEAAGDAGGGGVRHRDVQVLDVGTEVFTTSREMLMMVLMWWVKRRRWLLVATASPR